MRIKKIKMLRDRINTERLAQGFSFYRLANEAGLQRTQLTRYLRGETDLFGENIEKLLKVLKLDVCSCA